MTNNGSGAATNVNLNDVFPGTGWSIVSAQKQGSNLVAPDGCTLTGGNTLHCDVATLGPGESLVVIVQRATTTADCAGDTGTGIRLDNGSLTPDPSDDALADADNNPQVNDPGHLFVRCPDTKVEKEPDEGDAGNNVNVGSNAVFNITVTANGPGTSFNVNLTDNLPNSGLNWSVTGGADQPPPGGTTSCQITGAVGSQQLTCSFGDIPAGETRTVQVTSPTSVDDCGDIDNTVMITADGDVTAATNTDTGNIDVICGALQITKTAKHKGAGTANLVATFTVVDFAGNTHVITTNASGVGCADGMAIGMTQSITETTVPPGYSAPTIANVNVPAGECANGTLASGGVVVNVENTPLTDVNISINSQHPGATETTITCDDPTTPQNPDYTFTTPANGDGSLNIPNLPPVILSCTINIDP